MAKLTCRCGALLSDNDKSIEFIEIIKPSELVAFQDLILQEILSYFECKTKGVDEREKWILTKYKNFLPALKFDDENIIRDILTVLPAVGVVTTPRAATSCGVLRAITR